MHGVCQQLGCHQLGMPAGSVALSRFFSNIHTYIYKQSYVWYELITLEYFEINILRMPIYREYLIIVYMYMML